MRGLRYLPLIALVSLSAASGAQTGENMDHMALLSFGADGISVVDSVDVVRDRNDVLAWTTHDLLRPSVDSSAHFTYDSVKLRFRFDCKLQRYKILAMVRTMKDTVRSSTDWTDEEAEWKNLIPPSIGMLAMQKVCIPPSLKKRR